MPSTNQAVEVMQEAEHFVYIPGKVRAYDRDFALDCVLYTAVSCMHKSWRSIPSIEPKTPHLGTSGPFSKNIGSNVASSEASGTRIGKCTIGSRMLPCSFRECESSRALILCFEANSKETFVLESKGHDKLQNQSFVHI